MFVCCASQDWCASNDEGVVTLSPMLNDEPISPAEGPLGAKLQPNSDRPASGALPVVQHVTEEPPKPKAAPVVTPVEEPAKPTAVFPQRRPSTEREFKVQFTARDIGLTLDSAGDEGSVLIIELHKGGEALTWNAQNPEEKHIKHGDRMVEVKGVTTPKGILDTLKGTTRPLEVTIRRPVEFQVTLVKNATTPLIGLGIAPSGSQTLLLKMVKEGMVQEWNKANPSQQIRAGDRIVGLNGMRGDAQKLLEAIQSNSSLAITFLRNDNDC